MQTLRQWLTAFVLLAAVNTGKAQWVSIPDTNFGKWLNTNGFSQCLQGNSTMGWQMDTTCTLMYPVANMDMSNSNIYDCTGLEYFQIAGSYPIINLSHNHLTKQPKFRYNYYPQVLNCSYNNIDSVVFSQCLSGILHNEIDFSHNSLVYFGLVSPCSWPFGYINVSYNQLTSFPAFTAMTTYTIDLSHNNLTTLPQATYRCLLLDCSYNQLSVIQSNHIGVQCRSFNCSHNNITAINTDLSSSYPLFLHQNFDCSYNQLSNLQGFSKFTRSIKCNNNPLLTCLPKLPPVLQTLNYDSTQVLCLPNVPLTLTNVTPAAPVQCDVVNPHNCDIYPAISGNVWYDSTANCAVDSGEIFVPAVKVNLLDSNHTFLQSTISLNTGGFYFVLDSAGTYFVRVDSSHNSNLAVNCPASGLIPVALTDTSFTDTTLTFGITCSNGYDLKAQSIFAPVFTPALYSVVAIGAGDATNLYKMHCAAGISGNVTLSFTGPVKFIASVNGALTPTLTGNTLTWSIADFGAVNFFTNFNVKMQTDTLAQIGQKVCLTLTVNPIAGDNNPLNNTLTHCYLVRGPYDPNDKQAYPAGNIDTAQKELTYTVRFQNTGNAEAQHIYITDTLDANVRPETFELLAYSHQPMVQIDGNAVRFNFPNINLPDSFTNEPGSHGYVQYKVKLKENLPVGTTINNTAFIYFDFNAPVITNTTTNTVALVVDTTVGIRPVKTDAQVFVYPNPASNMVTVTVSENMHHATITITDMLGRKVMEPVTLNNTQTVTLNTQQLPHGVYLVNVKSGQGMHTIKRIMVSR